MSERTGGHLFAIDPYLDSIVEHLKTSRSCVISAPPGTGKSTRVPPYLLDKLSPKKSIVVVQPRRLAATSLASWVAQNRNTEVGKEVGYSVRFDRKASKETMIEFVTDGLLVRRLAGDPFLEQHEIVILDEFHERSLNTDLCAAFLRELMTVREDLKVVIMSATISAKQVSDYFDAPIVDVQVPQYPNEIEYLKKLPERRDDAVAKIVRQILDENPKQPGEQHEDILAFMPGKRDIENVRRMLETTDADVRVLHGSLTLAEQRTALNGSDQRRVILATNIAETSLTVPGVRIVVDSGIEKIDHVDPHTGFDNLVTQPISFASADQRAGRAAREGAGKTYRAWTKNSEFRMDNFRTSAIVRSDITGAVLQVAKWTNDLENFKWFEAPQESTFKIALKMLNAIGAIDDQHSITPFGEKLVDLPLPPRLAALVYHARQEGFAREGAYAAAVLSEPEFNLKNKPSGKVIKCDIGVRASQIAETGFPKNAFRVACQIEKECRKKGPINEQVIRKLLLKTFPDLFSMKRTPNRYALVSGGSAFVRLREKDRSDYVLVLRAFGTKKMDGVACSVANYVCEIDKKMIKEIVKRDIVPIFSEKDKRLDIFEIESFHGLELSRKRAATDKADPLEIMRIFAENVIRNWTKAFTVTDEVTQLIARMNLLDPNNPFEERMKDIEFVSMLVGGDRSFKATKKMDLAQSFMQTIPYNTQQKLKKELPAKYETPAGKFRKIDYSVSPPVLAVRIQEMFGLQTTPTVNEGKIRLCLHLLAPNSRPAQITEDLASFWENTYTEVRKELMVRYPKHNWPKNPANAQPQAK